MSARHRGYGHARRRSEALATPDTATAAGVEHRPTAVVTVASAARPVATGHDPAATTLATRAAVATVFPVTTAVASHDGPATGPLRWWVLDGDDDAACVRELLGLHDLERGRVVCHPRPDATWPVLVEDLLRALGKHPQALTRERRTREASRLLEVWLRAEQVRHLVVLRADRLRPEVLEELLTLPLECALWLVWHNHQPPPTPHPRVAWTVTAAALHADAASPATSEGDGYVAAYQAARGEARRWRPDGHRLGWQVPYWEHAWPGCDVGALLQRLTIDAADPAELRMRLHAAQHGFAAEGRRLILPDLDDRDLAVLGPRLTPAVITRLRELVCPATAAALMLGLATGAEAPFLAHQPATGWPRELGHVQLLAGTYRVPPRARPMLRAAVGNRDNPHRGQTLFAPPGKWWTSPQRLAHLVGRGAALTGISPPPAARPLYGINPATPFAAAIATRCTVTTTDNSCDDPLTSHAVSR